MKPWTYKYVSTMLRSYCRAFSIVRSGGLIQMDWASEPLDLAGFRREFMLALHKRINLKSGGSIRHGRKDSREQEHRWHRDKWRVFNINRAIRLRKPVARIYQFETPEVRRRFSHLLADREEI